MEGMKWIKISTDIFNDSKIKLIKAMPEGHTLICIWFQLLALAGREFPDGVLVINDKLPCTDEMLATIFEEPVPTVRLAMNVFSKMGMVTVSRDNSVTVTKWKDYQSVESFSREKELARERKRRQREREKEKKLTEIQGTSEKCHVMSRDSHVTVTLQNKNKNKNKNKSTTTTTISPPPSKTVTVEEGKNRGSGGCEPVLDFYGKNFQLRTPFMDELLLKLEDEYTAHWVVEAMKVAIKSNHRNIRYVEGILRRWQEDGFKADRGSGNPNALADVLDHIDNVLPQDIPGGDELAWLQEEGIGEYGSEQTGDGTAQGSVPEFQGRTGSDLRRDAK